ncbi:MAG: hypothetical protein C5B47_04815 [Verrucomicrobia bacterium]|nr:MAG: hypothetical protein C5B47_04815 [Verrucomicrobiota bacterium]
MIRVLHVIDSLDLGGGQTALLNLVRFAKRSQFHLEIANLHGQGVFREAFLELGIPVHSLSPHRWPPYYIPNLIRLLRRRRFHIVHCHLNASNWIAKPLAAACGVPIRIAHDQCNDTFRSQNPLITLLDALTNRFSSLILAVSRSTRDFLISHENLDPSRVVYLPNAVNTEYFRPTPSTTHIAAKEELGFEPGCFLVGGIGRLVPQKNYSAFLSACAQLVQQRPNSRFFIAGTGPEETKFRQFATDLGIADKGTFLGFVSDTRLLYHASDVLLIPSLYEGLPLVALEAMASGVPIVASAVDGLCDLIRSGETGLLASSQQAEEFAKLLLHLHDSPEDRQRIAAAARSDVQRHYDAKSSVEQVEQIYLNLLDRL